MKNALKAESRKIFSVRSTYGISAFCIAIVVLFAFYIEGIKSTGNNLNPGLLAGEATNAVNAVSAIFAIIGILLIAHEYRYNTIMYSLTSSRSRLKVMFVKIVALTVLALVFTLFISILSPVLTMLGLSIRHLTLVHQVYSVGDILWRCLFTGWAYIMIGLLLAFLLRSLVVSIVAYFLIPITIQPVLGLLLKENSAYLPFNALSSVLNKGDISPARGAVTVMIWLVVGWIVAGILFVRRDAN